MLKKYFFSTIIAHCFNYNNGLHTVEILIFFSCAKFAITINNIRHKSKLYGPSTFLNDALLSFRTFETLRTYSRKCLVLIHHQDYEFQETVLQFYNNTILKVYNFLHIRVVQVIHMKIKNL